MTPDNFDFVPGCAWHDGLTDPPQQGEEAGRIQQHQPACHHYLNDWEVYTWMAIETLHKSQATMTALSSQDCAHTQHTKAQHMHIVTLTWNLPRLCYAMAPPKSHTQVTVLTHNVCEDCLQFVI